MKEIETLQQKLAKRAEARIDEEIKKLRGAIEDALRNTDGRLRDALAYRMQMEIRCLGYSGGETFQSGLGNLLYKNPITKGLKSDLLPSYLEEVTQEFMNKVDSIGKKDDEDKDLPF